MEIAFGQKTKSDIDLDICVEPSGDSSSIDFCHRVGLTYVPCSLIVFKLFVLHQLRG